MAEFRKASTDFKSAFEEECATWSARPSRPNAKKAAEAVAASAAEPSPPSRQPGPLRQKHPQARFIQKPAQLKI